MPQLCPIGIENPKVTLTLIVKFKRHECNEKQSSIDRFRRTRTRN
jgi:hypothetical protein